MADKEFKDIFPAISEELERGLTQEYRIQGVRTKLSEKSEEKPAKETYIPGVIDYIRRCDTVSQAIEIVDWMLKRGEISRAEARDVKIQLKREGLRSFGTKKEKDYYLHHGLE
jgi:hypothetical protein